MNESILENLIAKFEREFSAGRSPDINQFVSESSGDSQELFIELIHTELELKIRAGKNARVEEYIERFPEIQFGSIDCNDLVDTEFKIRRLFEPGLSVDEYQRRFPDYFPDMIQKFASDISTSAGNGETIAGSPTAQLTFSDSNSRFRKLRLHQQGGLGNIWKAIDTELNRIVAIKEIKPKYSRLNSHRARFAREIIVSTKLEHPGILPIYGLGYLTDGTPYFAMQFISGITLKSAIEALEKSKPTVRKPSESIEFRRLLQHFLDVCNTIEYAHTQKVIHRDLKPANIMIGKFGETFVVDWGLAKVPNENINSRDLNTSIETSFEFMARESLSENSTDGVMIGSPGYMSPEQRTGKIEEINVVSDVYSLGATLLCLISFGKQPGTQIKNTPPSTIDTQTIDTQTIAADLSPLASVCRKAMQFDSAARYQSAKELAEDVERFLLDESVSAHDESTIESWSRYSRRHRAILNTVMLAFFVISIIATTAAFWINSERSKAVAATVAEGEQRKKVELSLNSEKKRTTQLTSNLGIFTDLFSGPNASDLCLDLEKVTLQQALNQLNERINEYSDPMAQSFLLTVLGRNKKVNGNYIAAKADFEKAKQLLYQENISKEDPLQVDVLIELCSIEAATGESETAEKTAREIIGICEKHPEKLQIALYETLLIYVPQLLRKNRLAEAEALCSRALKLGEEIYANDKSDNNYLWGQFVNANVLVANSKRTEADKIFQQIVEVQKANQTVHPIGISSRVRLSESLYVAGKKGEATKLITEALDDIRDVLGNEHPDTIKIQSWAGTILATNDHAPDRKKGIDLLEATLDFQLQNIATTSHAAVGTTSLLANVLLQQNNSEANQKAIDIGLKTIDQLEANNLNLPPKTLLPLFKLLSNAFEKQGDIDSAIHWSQNSIRISKELSGAESVATKQLIERQNALRKGVATNQ